MTDISIRQLNKKHINTLRKQIKPHPLVEKVLKMVCIMRGCIAPNWTMARELMSSMTFKLELMLMDPTQLKPILVKKVLKILNSNQKQLTPVNMLQIDQGASILLTWIINFVKWNSGFKKFNYADNPPGASNFGALIRDMDGSLQDQEFISQQQAFAHSSDHDSINDKLQPVQTQEEGQSPIQILKTQKQGLGQPQ